MDDLKKHTTKDGSLSLYSFSHKEGFHDNGGALKESIDKYLLPAQLEQFSNTKKIAHAHKVPTVPGANFDSPLPNPKLIKKAGWANNNFFKSFK